MLVPLMNATFIRRITRAAARMTTRKGARRHPAPLPANLPGSATRRTQSLGPAAFILAASALLLAGCSTPGPLHLYSVSPTPSVVHDHALAADGAQEVPAYVSPDERIVGFAYDPFTDHFFLRLAPGDRMRVVDRPARKIKREFPFAAAAAAAGDMAIRPRDGHVFLLADGQPALLEFTRFGHAEGSVTLPGDAGSPVALAIDMTSEHFLTLDRDGRTVREYDASGQPVRHWTLARRAGAQLACDGNRHELYAPLADAPAAIGVFDATGAWLRNIAIPAGDQFIDVGPHSFLRVF